MARSMVQSRQYREVEEKYGMPMPQVLAALLAEHSRDETAAIIGVNSNTLDRYLLVHGLHVVRVNVLRDMRSGEIVPVTEAARLAIGGQTIGEAEEPVAEEAVSATA